MRYLLMSALVVVAGAMVSVKGADSSTEERLKALEARVQTLETKVGLTASATAPAVKGGAAAPVAETKTATLMPSPAPAQSIEAKLMLKKVVTPDGGGEPELHFYVRFTNNFPRTVSGFEGTFFVRDNMGNRLTDFVAAINRSIEPGATDSWVGAIVRNNADEGHKKIAATDAEGLLVMIKLAKVAFSDGTVSHYAK